MILVECNADEAFVKFLTGTGKKQIRHFSGKSLVFNFLKKTEINSHIAMVDEDPHGGKHNYEQELTQTDVQHGIKVFEDKKQNKVIVIPENLEKWLIKICKNCKIALKEYGLSEKYEELHSSLHQKLDKFEILVEDLKNKQIPDVLYLQAVLKK